MQAVMTSIVGARKCKGCGGEHGATACMASGPFEGYWHPKCLRRARANGAELIGSTRVKLPDGTVWPRSHGGVSNLQRKLRYCPQSLSGGELADIAGILTAYAELVYATEARRNEVVRALRDAEARAAESESNVSPEPKR